MFIYSLIHGYIKFSGWIASFFAFRTKIYYEDKAVQNRYIKGPAILISNHTAVIDFMMIIYVFWNRTLRYQMAEVLFKKKFLGPLLRALGGIYVDRNTFDFGFVGKSQNILDKGGIVGIFPEARIPLPGEKTPLPFAPSAAYLAYTSGVKVIPMVTNGSYFNSKRRAKVLIGKPFYVGQWWDASKPRRENLQYVSEKMREEIARLQKELKRREELDALRPPFYYFLFDLMKISAAIPMLIKFRPKTVYSSPAAKRKYKKGVLFFSNHTGFGDPLYIMIGIWYRRINFVAMQEIFDNPKMTFLFSKCFRAIPVDRNNVGFGSFKRLTQFLNAGAAVSIFPEGHIKTSDSTVDDFKNGVVLMGIKGKAPLVPLYFAKREHWYERLVMFQGEPIDLMEMYGPMPTMAQIEEAGRICRDRELELAKLAESYYKKDK